MDITINSAFQATGATVHIGIVEYSVVVAPSPPALLNAVEEGTNIRREDLIGEAASSDPVIACIRAGFKACGKDPNRYRPSSEALIRRILSGKGLYCVNNVVDCGNLTSIMTGIPIGCYDGDKIKGTLELRLGAEGDTYNGISRGNINLANLPILSDDSGPFGSPFSDSERTAVTEKTTRLLFAAYGIGADVAHIEAAAEMADTLISTFCCVENDAPTH